MKKSQHKISKTGLQVSPPSFTFQQGGAYKALLVGEGNKKNRPTIPTKPTKQQQQTQTKQTLLWNSALWGASMKCLYTNTCSMGNKNKQLEINVQLQGYNPVGITWTCTR